MPKATHSSSSFEQKANFRYLKPLIAVLVASNIMLGVLSVYLLRTLDRDYSLLIDQSVPVMNELRAANKSGASAYRAMLWTMVASASVPRADALRAAQKHLLDGKLIRSQMAAADIFKDRIVLTAQLQTAGAAYDKAAVEFLEFMAKDSLPLAAQAQFAPVRPVFKRYIASIEQAGNFVEKRSRSMNDEYSARMRSRSVMVLSIASWPVLVVAMLMVLTGTIVVSTLFVFRHAEVGDQF